LLVDKTSNHLKTDNEKIFIENIQTIEEVDKDVAFIKSAFENLNNAEIKEMIGKFVPTYTAKN